MTPLTITGTDVKKFLSLHNDIEKNVRETVELAEKKLKNKNHGLTSAHHKNIVNMVCRHYYGKNRDTYIQIVKLTGIYRKYKNMSRIFSPTSYPDAFGMMSETQIDYVIRDYNQYLENPFMRIAISTILISIVGRYTDAFLVYKDSLKKLSMLSKRYSGVISADNFRRLVCDIVDAYVFKHDTRGLYIESESESLNNEKLEKLTKEIAFFCGIKSNSKTYLRFLVLCRTGNLSVKSRYYSEFTKEIIAKKMVNISEADALGIARSLRKGEIPGTSKHTMKRLHGVTPALSVELKTRMNKGKKSSDKFADVVAIIQYLEDNVRVINEHHVDGARVMREDQSITRMIKIANWNHEHLNVFKERANERRIVEYRKEANLPAPVPEGPSLAEKYRLKTIGDIRNAGEECGHCVGGYAKGTNAWIYRKENVVAGIYIHNNRVFNCYDKGNTVTEESKAFEKELMYLVAKSLELSGKTRVAE